MTWLECYNKHEFLTHELKNLDELEKFPEKSQFNKTKTKVDNLSSSLSKK